MSNEFPLHARDQLQLFLSHLKAGRKQDANAVLKRILDADFSKAAPYSLLIGGMLAQNGQHGEAVPLYEEAIRLNPAEPTAYFYLGVAYHALKQESECERIWDELAKRFPQHATAYYQRALRALKSNQPLEAKSALERAVELLEPANPLRDDAIKTLAAIEHDLRRQD